MKGLSGAVTALILVIASVVIALIVVGFAFNLFGAYGSQSALTAPGPAYIQKAQNGYLIVVTISNTGTNPVAVTGISVQNTPVTVNNYAVVNSAGVTTTSGSGLPVIPPGGQYTLSLTATGVPNTLVAGSTYSITIYFANGQSVVVNAIYQG